MPINYALSTLRGGRDDSLFMNEGVYPIHDVCSRGVKQKGTLLEWQTNILPLCLDNSRLLFSIGIALSSICLTLINEEGCGFNFKGRSSIGKSKCLKLAITEVPPF